MPLSSLRSRCVWATSAMEPTPAGSVWSSRSPCLRMVASGMLWVTACHWSGPVASDRPTKHADDGDAPAALLTQCACVVACPFTPHQSRTSALSIGALPCPLVHRNLPARATLLRTCQDSKFNRGGSRPLLRQGMSATAARMAGRHSEAGVRTSSADWLKPIHV